MTTQDDQPQVDQSEVKSAFEKRLDTIGWALFLIMFGCLWLIPEERVPDGAWLMGAGVIILVLQMVRRANNLKLSGFWIFVGLLALGAGISDFYAMEVPVFPILLVIFGILILLEPVRKRLKGE